MKNKQRALKALRLNGDTSPDYSSRLLTASSITKKKPIVRIRRLSFSGSPGIRLKGASNKEQI
jgi:hypothetical protein